MIKLAVSNATFLAIIWNGAFLNKDLRKTVERLSKAPTTLRDAIKEGACVPIGTIFTPHSQHCFFSNRLCERLLAGF